MSVTTEQSEALLAFAASLGPQWKRALIQLWKTRTAPEPLQEMELSHGQIWLEALDLGILAPGGVDRPRRPPTPQQVSVLRVLAALKPGEALTGPELSPIAPVKQGRREWGGAMLSAMEGKGLVERGGKHPESGYMLWRISAAGREALDQRKPTVERKAR